MNKTKFIALFLILTLLFSSAYLFCGCDQTQRPNGCVSHVDANNDGVCDKCGKKIDNEQDQIKDPNSCTAHIDVNGDDLCDHCGKDMNNECDKRDDNEHVDVNDDGLCDSCGESVVANLDFYAINDIHGSLVDSGSINGVGGLTTYLLNAQENGNAYVLSSGDTWQGGSESNNTLGLLATEWLNYIGCVSMTLGNHEFDWSTDAIKKNAAIANFPLLAINVYERESDERVPYCSPSVMLEADGAKIGIIGAIGDCYSSISASMCGDVYFKVNDELTMLVKEEATSLRERGADYIIYSIHDGGSRISSGSTQSYLSWYDSSLSDGYVDLVFEGHTHQSYTFYDSYGVNHIQAGGYNQGISHATISVNVANGKSTTGVEIISSKVYSNYAKNDIIETLSKKYSDLVKNPDEVIGYASSNIKSGELCDIMAQAYYKFALEQWSEYDIVLGGGYINSRKPYNIYKGDVTIRTIQTLFPFNNSMTLCTIKGIDLRDRFFNTDNSAYHIAYGDYGREIREKLNNGEGLNDIYYIVVDSYSSDYAPNNLTVVESLGDTVYPRDLLQAYLVEYYLS